MNLEIITGDNALVAATVARAIGPQGAEVLTGLDLGQMSDAALLQRVNRASIFAEVEPNQKERIILALRVGGVGGVQLLSRRAGPRGFEGLAGRLTEACHTPRFA